MRIIDEEGCYWTENSIDKSGYWSAFMKLEHEKRDFFFVKAIILSLAMRLSGVRARLKTNGIKMPTLGDVGLI